MKKKPDLNTLVAATVSKPKCDGTLDHQKRQQAKQFNMSEMNH